MTSRLKVLHLLSKYPWGGEKCKMGNMYVFNAHFGSSFCCLISQFSHSSIPRKKKLVPNKIHRSSKKTVSKVTEQMDPAFNSRDSSTLQKDILTIYLPIRCIMSSNLQFSHVQMTFSWYKKGHNPLPKLSSHIPPPHSTDPLLLRTR